MSLHVGDTTPPFTAVCSSAGTPANLAGASVKVHVRKPDRTVLVLDGSPGVNGNVAAAWPEALDQAGEWSAEVQVQYSDGGVQTFGPQSFVVQSQIA